MHKIVLLLITISTLWSIAIVIDAGDAACSLAMDFDDSNTGMQGDRQKRLFHKFEQEAISKGWKRLNLEIDGRQRQLLFKAPGRNWKNGVIITFHGGGGSYSNFSANLPIGKPMVDFAEMALEEGFAVISPDSTEGEVTGINGLSAGKRWDCLAKDSYTNIDLPFIEKILSELIPKLRPPGSSRSVFLTGISNGGFMTILAATNFCDKITAFAPVSAGDPYGTYLKCNEWSERKTAPGIFHDSETHKPIHEENAATADAYPHEKPWPEAAHAIKAPFKQFQHELDSGVDVSCMRKAGRMLRSRGYRDDGCMLLGSTGRKRLVFHLWRPDYNRPMLDFFKKNVVQ